MTNEQRKEAANTCVCMRFFYFGYRIQASLVEYSDCWQTHVTELFYENAGFTSVRKGWVDFQLLRHLSSAREKNKLKVRVWKSRINSRHPHAHLNPLCSYCCVSICCRGIQATGRKLEERSCVTFVATRWSFSACWQAFCFEEITYHGDVWTVECRVSSGRAVSMKKQTPPCSQNTTAARFLDKQFSLNFDTVTVDCCTTQKIKHHESIKVWSFSLCRRQLSRSCAVHDWLRQWSIVLLSAPKME